jgi:hypothetical protein
MLVLQHISALLCEVFSVTLVGPAAWPSRSPDFNPLNVGNEEALHHGNVDPCQTIHNCADNFG